MKQSVKRQATQLRADSSTYNETCECSTAYPPAAITIKDVDVDDGDGDGDNLG